jgi:hypothetical protein
MFDLKQQETTAKNLQEVSFYLFFTLGITHILSGLLLANQFYITSSWLVNRLLDIPFLITTLCYIYASLKLHLLKEKIYSHTTDLIFATVFFIIGFTVFLADLIFSNQLPTIT